MPDPIPQWTTIRVRRKPDAALRQVVDGQRYFIRRHGGWFRPHANGYTMEIARAGTYTAREARHYLRSVEDIEIVPVASAHPLIRAQIAAKIAELAALSAMVDGAPDGR